MRNLEDRPVDLVGSLDGRAYSRPSVTIDGKPTEIELQLRLMEPGRHSLLSRVGRITDQAATLKPFGAWWWWILALALVSVAPLGVLSALRAGLAADAGVLAADRRPPGTWPAFPRTRARLAALPGWALVAAIMTLAVAWFCYWSFSTHVFQNDEDQYVYLSRWLQQDFPASLFAFDAYGRGLQRLEVWLLAIPAALFDAPWSLQGGRLLNAIAFVSTAIPVYLLARRLSLRPAWAALPAALSIAVPWAVVTTGFLTENIAYPLFMWVLWAVFRAATDPRWWRDLLALVLLVVAGAARSGLLILIPVLPIVVAGTALRCGSGPIRGRLLVLAREHFVLWAAVGVGVLALVAGPLGFDPAAGLVKRLAGGYVVQTTFDTTVYLAKIGDYLSKVILGTGFFAAAAGLPWVAVQLVRSRDPNRFAFALLVPVAAITMLYPLHAAGPDERYIIYLAPLVLLPAAAAVAHRELRPVGIAVMSVALAALLARVPWTTEHGPFGYFVEPVEMFYTHAIGLRFDRFLPGDAADARMAAAVALAAAGVALAVLLRRAPHRLAGVTGAAIVAAIALAVPVQAHYTLSKYVNGAGSRSGPSVRERAFADTLVPAGATVGEFAEGVGQQPGFFGIWREVQFYNQRIDTVFALGENKNPVPPGDGLVAGVAFDERTGRITSPEPLPDYLVAPAQIGAARVRGEIVAAPSYIPVILLRVAHPATLDWSAKGFDPIGNVAPGAPGEVRFYGAGLRPGPQCASIALLAPPEAPSRYRLKVEGGLTTSGTVPAGQTVTATVILPQLAQRGFVDVLIGGEAVRVAAITLGC